MKSKDNNKEMPREEQAAPQQPLAEELAALKQQLETLQKEKDELFQQLQRLSADYANYQKRTPRQIADSVAYERECFIRSLLPALDNFDQARVSLDKEMTADTMRKGIELLHHHLLDILKSHGVEAIDSIGKPFDPSLHQAVMQKEVPQQNDGIVLEEYQKCYKFGDRVIRPARVVVNKLSAPPAEDETTDLQ